MTIIVIVFPRKVADNPELVDYGKTMKKVPNADAALVAEGKITEYLLNPGHPDGAGKACFFLGLGFPMDQWEVLATALKNLVMNHSLTNELESPHGRKYIVEGALKSPPGKSAWVRSVWIIDEGQDTPRLVTAYPLEERA